MSLWSFFSYLPRVFLIIIPKLLKRCLAVGQFSCSQITKLSNVQRYFKLLWYTLSLGHTVKLVLASNVAVSWKISAFCKCLTVLLRIRFMTSGFPANTFFFSRNCDEFLLWLGIFFVLTHTFLKVFFASCFLKSCTWQLTDNKQTSTLKKCNADLDCMNLHMPFPHSKVTINFAVSNSLTET